MSLEESFTAAVKVVQSLPSAGPYHPSNSTKLKFYSLYKQGTEGKCSGRKPALWDVIARAKWCAWNKLGDMDKEKAMNAYIEELKKLVEAMSYDRRYLQDFLDSVGPFYEFISLTSPELDGVKEQIDRILSSDSKWASYFSAILSRYKSHKSSPDSTGHNPSAKEVNDGISYVMCNFAHN